MPDKLMRLWRHDQEEPRRPVMLAIAGDSAAGKTTLTRGIAETLGPGLPGFRAPRCSRIVRLSIEDLASTNK